MNKLLPCPFCAGEAEFGRIGTPRQSCIVACTDCGGRLESNEEGGACGSQWNDRHVPDGWQCVPAAPTLEMQKAYFDSIDENMQRVKADLRFGRFDNQRLGYQRMLAAAPKPGGGDEP
ncbi:hypothetical protein C6W88_15800 [Halomonas litopenaei]|uniref:Restriction alleviation protein, Lar family n=1 Tax=Halomonas litopenaei TaxID=2109328 RepID=A0ABX5IVW0_9GAMM|nr:MULTISPECIES: Lar family restriction alleviation protein [Halomonas]PTL88579.1 hypothetical protein C6W89_20935 [Halomonas sp. SYSU XM8]PTL93474.1 hypothetical protein C6W88_15800 [Halomonas litopenaei]